MNVEMTEIYVQELHSRLKTCKYCHNNEELTVGKIEEGLFGGGNVLGYVVKCYGCGTETRTCKTPENAVKAWNRRMEA